MGENDIVPAHAWNPRVTALVPTYNGAQFIQRTLDSLAAQTWTNLEILIGDDCSTDDTLQIVRRFASEHPDTRVLEREANLGWLRNSNELMARAHGELMFFAFHDDVVAPTYVEELVRALAGNRAGGARVQRHDRPRSRRTESASMCSASWRALPSPVERARVMVARPDDWWVPNRGLFRASAFAEVGGIHPNEQGEYSADWTWLLSLSLVGEFVRVPGVLCDKFYKTRSLSKRWPHDSTQLLALQRAGIAEIRSSALSPVQKLWLARYLWRRIYGRRVPPSGQARPATVGLVIGGWLPASDRRSHPPAACRKAQSGRCPASTNERTISASPCSGSISHARSAYLWCGYSRDVG